MRISDWSSDVCSSDLPGWQAGRRACAPWASDAADADVLEFGVVGQAVLRALAADSRLLHSAERRDLGRDQPGVDADDAAFERLGHAPRARQVTGVEIACQADLRSEEHTSDLQSLMRISYAVFCLKKT